jgi:hypothetical protein
MKTMVKIGKISKTYGIHVISALLVLVLLSGCFAMQPPMVQQSVQVVQAAPVGLGETVAGIVKVLQNQSGTFALSKGLPNSSTVYLFWPCRDGQYCFATFFDGELYHGFKITTETLAVATRNWAINGWKQLIDPCEYPPQFIAVFNAALYATRALSAVNFLVLPSGDIIQFMEQQQPGEKAGDPT